jgi:hypothetical protein
MEVEGRGKALLKYKILNFNGAVTIIEKISCVSE